VLGKGWMVPPAHVVNFVALLCPLALPVYVEGDPCMGKDGTRSTPVNIHFAQIQRWPTAILTKFPTALNEAWPNRRREYELEWAAFFPFLLEMARTATAPNVPQRRNQREIQREPTPGGYIMWMWMWMWMMMPCNLRWLTG
jgi:hypothetical protein